MFRAFRSSESEWDVHANIAWMREDDEIELGGTREELLKVLVEERSFLDRLIGQAGDPRVPAARLVDLVAALERLDRDVERLIGQLREETTEARRQQEERSIRQFVLRALDGVAVPQNAAFLQEYMWARERVDLDTRGFGALRRDERRSWERNPGRRRAYVVPAVGRDGSSVSRLMARSDWPLDRRLVLPDDERLIDLAKLQALFAARGEVEAGDLPDPFEVLIEKYATVLFPLDERPRGEDPRSREARLEGLREGVESEVRRLRTGTAADRARAATRVRSLSEEQQLWGLSARV
jgi:hypothetical protein